MGCTDTNPEFCELNTQCGDGLVCDTNTNRCASAPDATPTQDASPALDADIAEPDAALSDLRFDIAYVNDWNYNLNDTAVEGWMIVINTGVVPFNMNDFQVRGIVDDHPQAAFSFMANPHDVTVDPGFAAGWLFTFDNTEALLLDSGLVPEPRVDFADESSSLVLMRMAGAPIATYDVAIEIVVGIDDVETTLPITVHVLPFPTTWRDAQQADRVSAP